MKNKINTAWFWCLTFLFLSINGNLRAQSIDSLLQLVVENNPDLKALNLEYNAELARKNQVNNLPNPQIGIGIPVLPPETRLGPQVLMVSASQMFPWFGTFAAKEDVVIAMSNIKYEKIAALKLELFYELKLAYYQLYFLAKNKEIIAENIKIFKSIERIALSKVESGKASIADVLRIQSDLQALTAQKLMIANQQKGFESKINALTKRPFDSPLSLPDRLAVPALNYNLEWYRKKIATQHPIINQLNYEIETSQRIMEVNKNTNSPTLGLGLDYNMVQARTDANPMYNGRDILVPKVMLSIPIYRKAYRAINEEETLIQASLAEKKESVVDKMTSQLAMYKSVYDNAQLSIELYQNQYQTIKSAYVILLSKYSSDGIGFEELLGVQNQLLSFELKLQEAILKANNAQANIERITNF